MANISIPISQQIYHAIAEERRRNPERQRGYLGASGIGGACRRSLWYSFRWFSPQEEHDGKLLRLFRRGHHEEPYVIADLRLAGYDVREGHEREDGSFDQFSVEAIDGHLRGHLDGIVSGGDFGDEWLVLEIKTHKSTKFDEVRTHGVEAKQPSHYAQMQVYMGLTHLLRALYVAVNKDDDNIYTEVVEFNEEKFGELLKKAEQIIDAGSPPLRMQGAKRGKHGGEPKEAWACGLCNHKQVCLHGARPNRTCRSCEHAAVADEGRWYCTKHERVLSVDEQLAACDDYDDLVHDDDA